MRCPDQRHRAHVGCGVRSRVVGDQAYQRPLLSLGERAATVLVYVALAALSTTIVACYGGALL